MARFSTDFLDELRARLPVSAVVGEKIKLRKAGREFKGLSPFAEEKTPSFCVNDAKQFWFDFSSGRNGTIFDFVMATEGCSFPEAVERLARKAGMALPAVSEQEQERSRVRASMREIHEMAAAWFEKQLAHSNGAESEAATARAYLTARGISNQHCAVHRIGYAPSDPGLLKAYLTKQGAGIEDLVDSGLIAEGHDEIYRDRFRARIIFPIMDVQGRVIAFAGRAVKPDVQPKYLNSPETAIYTKGATLYNAHRARAAAYKGEPLVVVEGYTDVVAVDAAGHAAVVATCGTAVTEQHLVEMWRWTDEPVVCLDGDVPGLKAAARTAEGALPLLGPGKSLRFATLNGGDPDELVRRDGAEAIRGWLAHAEPLAEFLFRTETVGLEIDTPESAAGLEARLREIVLKVGDRDVRRHYGQHFKKALSQFFQGRPVAGYVPPGAPKGGRFGRVSWAEQDSPGASEYGWVIKHVIPENETVAMIGPTQSGKSFAAFDMGLHIALGAEYRGNRVRQGLVIYCAAEGGAGMRDRMRASRIVHNLPLDDVPFEVLTQRFNIFAGDVDTQALIAEIKAIRDEWDKRGMPLRLIVIDTLSAVTQGWNEIASTDTGTVRARLKAIEEAGGCGVMFVHHTNAEGIRARGHGSIINDVETEIVVNWVRPDGASMAADPLKDDDGRALRRVHIRKQRQAASGKRWDFVLRAVDVRVDRDGDAVTSCVVEMPARSAERAYDPVEHPAGKRKGLSLSIPEVALFKALLEALRKTGYAAPPSMQLPGGARVVAYADVAEAYRQQNPMDEGDDEEKWKNRLKARIRYTREKLSNLGAIGVTELPDGGGHVIWPTGKPVHGKGLVWPPPKPERAPAADDDEANEAYELPI